MIRQYTGETVKIEVVVLDEENPLVPPDLSSAVAKFACINLETNVTIEKDAVITDNVVTARLESDETLVPGRYKCEIRILVDGDVDSIFYENMILKEAIMTTIEEDV